MRMINMAGRTKLRGDTDINKNPHPDPQIRCLSKKKSGKTTSSGTLSSLLSTPSLFLLRRRVVRMAQIYMQALILRGWSVIRVYYFLFFDIYFHSDKA